MEAVKSAKCNKDGLATVLVIPASAAPVSPDG
jgi:hypothetical protein